MSGSSIDFSRNYLTNIKNLIQLPTKQKIDDNTIITRELIESFKYTPEELKIIEKKYKLYENTNKKLAKKIGEYIGILYMCQLSGLSQNNPYYDYLHAIDVEIINIHNSVYAMEYIIMKYGVNNCKIFVDVPSTRSIIRMVENPYIYFLRILGNFERYNNKICYVISNEHQEFNNIDEVLNIINGKTIKESFRMIGAML